MNQGKAKCDRMLTQLDRYNAHKMVKESVISDSYKNHPTKAQDGLKWQRNGLSSKIPEQYRNTTNGMNHVTKLSMESRIANTTISKAAQQARDDSFTTATKNVASELLKKYKHR